MRFKPTSLAFPSISTGIYGYPIAAARIAVDTVRAALPRHPEIRAVIFCCYSAADLAVHEPLLACVSASAEHHPGVDPLPRRNPEP